MGLREVLLGACGCTFMVRCPDDATSALVSEGFGGLVQRAAAPRDPIGRFVIERVPEGGYRVSLGGTSQFLEDEDSLLFHLDKEIILALQYKRSDLFFLHAAAVGLSRGVVVLSAASGTGKSTLTLAAVQDGFDYLSDELAPIDLGRLTVEAYPHAICLKSAPPAPVALPAGTVEYGGRFQVPVNLLPSATHGEARPLIAFVFLRRDEQRFEGLLPISSASAVARLLANTLNSLAHAHAGFDAAIALSRAIPCFELDTHDLRAATSAVKTSLSKGV